MTRTVAGGVVTTAGRSTSPQRMHQTVTDARGRGHARADLADDNGRAATGDLAFTPTAVTGTMQTARAAAATPVAVTLAAPVFDASAAAAIAASMPFEAGTPRSAAYDPRSGVVMRRSRSSRPRTSAAADVARRCRLAAGPGDVLRRPGDARDGQDADEPAGRRRRRDGAAAIAVPARRRSRPVPSLGAGPRLPPMSALSSVSRLVALACLLPAAASAQALRPAEPVEHAPGPVLRPGDAALDTGWIASGTTLDALRIVEPVRTEIGTATVDVSGCQTAG